MESHIPSKIEGVSLRWKCAICFALVSLCLLVTGVLLIATYDVGQALLTIVGFPSMLLLLAIRCFLDIFSQPDAMADADWVIFGVMLSIPSVCFWGGMGWVVGCFIDKRRRRTAKPRSQ